MLILSALANKPTSVFIHNASDDIKATAACLGALGAHIQQTSFGFAVTPIRDVPPCPLLDCRESASTLRFLLPVACALTDHASFIGGGRLPERPVAPLMRAMRARGVSFSNDRLPFQTRGRLTGGAFELPGDVSSQFVTGLLLALPMLEGDSCVALTSDLESSAYVRVTLAAMKRFGVRVAQRGGGYDVPGRRYVSPGKAYVAGDWSSATFFLAAGALGSAVAVIGLDLDSPQGDRRIVKILRDFGARVAECCDAVTVMPGTLRAQTVNVRGIPDLLPPLAVVAACARGETRFVGAARLRLKESDRLRACAELIRALGGEAEETPDTLTVRGEFLLSGGTVDSRNDHRVAMAAALASVRCAEPVTILRAEAVDKSYPSFYADFRSLGGHADVV